MADFIPRPKRIPAFFLFLWILTNPLHAQVHPVRYGLEDGLSSRACNCAIQDESGFIWIGTSNGLDRFDGYHFQHHDIGEGIGNNVYSICSDLGGRLWLGTGRGVYIYDIAEGSIRPFTLETEWGVSIYSKVNVIKLMDGDHLFIGTDGQGFFVHDLSDSSFRQFSLHASMVSAIAGCGDDHVLIGSEEGTISLHRGDGSFIRVVCSDSGTSEPRGAEITSMTVVDGVILAGMGNKGFCSLRLEGDHAPDHWKPAGVSGNFVVNCQTLFGEDELILGGRDGLYVFSTKDRLFRRVYGESGTDFTNGANVGSLFIDMDGGLWCTLVNSGLLYLPPESKAHRGLMPEWNVTAIAKDAKGGFWFGTLSGNLFKAGPSGLDPERIPVSFPDIRCLMVDLPEVWIGTSSDGLYIYNTAGGQVKNLRYDRYDQTTLSDNCINAIFKDSEGRIYVGTEWGLSYYNRNRGRFRFEPRSTNRSQVTGFFEDSKANVWILTDNDGAFRVSTKGKGWEHFFTGRNPNLPSNEINCAQEDGKGRIWLGTGDGLCAFSYESRSFAGMFQDGSFLDGRDIFAIEKDDDNHLWVATDAEITCVDTEEDQIAGILYPSDGLCCKQFIQNVSSAINGKTLLFGGIQGIDRFSARNAIREMNQTPRVPGLRVTEVSVSGELLKEAEELVLKHNAADIVIRFSDLDFRHAGKKKYEYRMEGLNENWVASSEAAAAFSKLPKGKHLFQVRIAGSPTEIADETPARLEFKVLPPFYASIWAYLIYGLIIAALVQYGIHLYKKKNEEANYREKYDFFTNLTHEIRTPLTLIKAPLEKIITSDEGTRQTKNYLQIIQKSTNDLINLVNQFLDYRKNEDGHYVISKRPCNLSVTTEDLVERFRPMAEAEQKHIEISLPDQPCSYEIDQDAYGKIIHNLLSNAVKYAESLIRVDLVAEEDGFQVLVGNDGAKIGASDRESIFKMFYQVNGSKAGTGIGLPLARMLARRHGGELSVRPDSELTTFVLSIPGQRETIELPDFAPNVPDNPLPQEDSSAPRATILEVDDNEDLRHMVVEILREQYDVLEAGNGKEAIDVLEENAVDLILCDVIMPEMDGYQLCEYVKTDMRYSNIPFVLITAKTELENKVKGFDYGADDFIEKPFSPVLLLTKLKAILDNRRRMMEFYRGLPIVHPTQVSRVTKSNAAFIIKMKEELEKHLSDESYNMVSMAESMYMSQSSLYRKVKSLTGVSPNEFVRDFRLQKAAEMLSSGEYLANEVYQKVGFNSVSYFSLCFKKKYGVSPVRYVESVKQTVKEDA